MKIQINCDFPPTQKKDKDSQLSINLNAKNSSFNSNLNITD